jgi:chromosome segregation ATPase
VSSSDTLLEALVVAYSRKYNIPPEQARQILQPLLSKPDRLRELEEFVKRVDSVKPVIEGLPEEAKTPASLLILRELLGSGRGGGEEELTRAAIAKELLRSLRDDSDIRRLEARLDELSKRLETLVAEQAKRSALEELSRKLEELGKRLDELQSRISQPQVPQQPQAAQPSPLEELAKKLEERFKSIEDRINQIQQQPQQLKSLASQVFKELEETIELAKKYGFIREAQPAAQGQQVQLSEEQMAEELKRRGYVVRKLSEEELRRQLDEERKRLEEELSRKFEMDRARMQYAMELLREAIREVAGPIVRELLAASRDALRESVLRRMEELYRQVSQQTQATPQPQQVAQTTAGGGGAVSQGGGGQGG